jgi:hypothetical protein
VGVLGALWWAAGWARAAESDFAYQRGAVSGTRVTETADGWRGEGEGGFQVQLKPAQGEAWNMSGVSLLGLEFRNTGRSDLVLDLRVNNAGATDWSNSALGRTIVRAGEAVPLVVGLPRAAAKGETHAAFLRMAGRPDGSFRHWHHVDPSRVVSVDIHGGASGAHRFEVGRLKTWRAMAPWRLEEWPMIDRYGQYMHAEWPGKVKTDDDLKRAAREEQAWSAGLGQVADRGRYGGWASGPRREATGRFRVEKIGERWWFVDPDGLLFWSHGVTGVGTGGFGGTPVKRDERVFAELPAKDDLEWGMFYDAQGGTYLFGRANLKRKYGEGWMETSTRQEAARVVYSGLNTIAAWSAPEVIQAGRTPYTAMVHFVGVPAATGLPDPFDPRTREALRAAFGAYPVAFRDDALCVGAFINNELPWGKGARGLAAAVLGFVEKDTAVKRAMRAWLERKYGTVDALNAAWGVALADWAAVTNSTSERDWAGMPDADASALATLMAEAYYAMVDEELKAYAPGVLNLGSRLHTKIPEVIAAAARHVDVMSANVYAYDPSAAVYAVNGRPVLLSEYHFGNLTGANLGSGLKSAQDATQQARLFRRYAERAAADPAVVGAHWFQWRDQNVGGRGDGENYEIGFFDVTDQPKRELLQASAEFARELYRLRR